MRVLLATDGSASSDRARELVAGLTWPGGSVVRVLAAIDLHLDVLAAPFAVPSPEMIDELDAQLVRHAELALDSAERVLTEAGLRTERVTRSERAADAIIDEARSWLADLVVVGSRGHSTLTTMLVGSTSAEVVDHAPCPVLVVHEHSIGEIVLATDGSSCARAAERLLVDWPMFHGRRTTVVSVAPAPAPWTLGLAAGIYDPSIAATDQGETVARQQAAEIAAATAARLRDAGFDALERPLEGDAAGEIVAATHGLARPLIVMGSRGHTGLARLLLGGVARNVLNHATGSVLIVRQGVRVASTDVASAPRELAGSAAGR